MGFLSAISFCIIVFAISFFVVISVFEPLRKIERSPITLESMDEKLDKISDRLNAPKLQELEKQLQELDRLDKELQEMKKRLNQ